MFSGKIKGIIDFSGLPKTVEQNSKLSGNGNDRSLFSVLASPFGQLQSPTSQVTVRSEGTEDVLGEGDEQATQEGIASLGDSQLRVMVAGLIPSGDQTDCGSDLPALPEGHRDDVRKRSGFSSVRMKAREVSGPTPLTERSSQVSGWLSLQSSSFFRS